MTLPIGTLFDQRAKERESRVMQNSRKFSKPEKQQKIKDTEARAYSSHTMSVGIYSKSHPLWLPETTHRVGPSI